MAGQRWCGKMRPTEADRITGENTGESAAELSSWDRLSHNTTTKTVKNDPILFK